jgi:hypothetical protein
MRGDVQVLQLYRPPPLPPITELARPEIKLAGLRIDEEMNSRSRMSYYTGTEVILLHNVTQHHMLFQQQKTRFPSVWGKLMSLPLDMRPGISACQCKMGMCVLLGRG